MMDPRDNMRRYMLWSFILILVLLITGVAVNKAHAKTCDVIVKDKCYKDGKLIEEGYDLNLSEFGYTQKVVSTEVVGNTEFDTKVANLNKVETILEKIEKIESDKGVYYDKITTITPKKVDGQYCFIKVIIKQTENTIIKEEILECADGRKKFDGPSYWELFAQFYYRDISTPEYCRMYSRNKHMFKTPGKVCLTIDGEWEVR